MRDDTPWADCPSGVMTEMALCLRRRRRQARQRPLVLGGVAVLLLCFAGYGLTIRDDPGARSALTCRETVPLLTKYHDRSLDAALASDVREHLSKCPACRKHYAELYPSEVRNRASAKPRQIALAARFRR